MYAIYLRKSREDERNFSDEDTLLKHERALLDLAKRNNYEIGEIYREIVSGASLNKRHEMLKLIDDIYLGKYEGVICIDLARLSRGDSLDNKIIYDCFKRNKIKIITLMNTYDFSSQIEFNQFSESGMEEELMFEQFFNMLDLKTIIGRLTRGRHQAQKEGYFIGTNVSFGYTKKRLGKGFVLIPDENAKYVKMIYDKYLNDGLKISEIRDWLNTLNLTTKSFKGDKWDNSRVYRILTNITYLGYIRAQTYRKDTLLKFAGKHEPLIDKDTFDKVQVMLNENKKDQLFDINKRIINPFMGILKCKCCNMPLEPITNHLNLKDDIRLETNNPNCISKGARLSDIEDSFIDELEKRIKEYTKQLIDLDEYPFILNDKDRNNIDINTYQILLKKCEMNYKKGFYNKEIYQIRKKRLLQDIKAIENKTHINDLDVTSIKRKMKFLFYFIDKYKVKKSNRDKYQFITKYIDTIYYERIDDIKLDIIFKDGVL